jgi:hypothetical protein
VGVRIALFTPEWDRSCKNCLTYQYRQDGTVDRHPGTGEYYRRTVPTPCQSCPKPPVWAKRAGLDEERLRELARPYDFTPQNRSAYDFYKQCAATHSFPDPPDPIVNWYSGMIRDLELEYQRSSGEKSYQAIKFLCELIIADWKRRR